MTATAPAWEDDYSPASSKPSIVDQGQRTATAVGLDPTNEENDLDLSKPTLAAAVIRDAERRCLQQRERTSQAMERALAEVIKAGRAAQAETVRHQLRDLHDNEKDGQDDRGKAWTPHTRVGHRNSWDRKAKVGRATGLVRPPAWAKDFHEMKRRVSWASALESTIEDEVPPFLPEVPLEPPPAPVRRGTIVSAVLAAVAESPSSPPSTSSERNGTMGNSGPVLDDDWVVRKFAQIRRRSRGIDSAIGDISGLHKQAQPSVPVVDARKTSPNTHPMRIGGMVTLEPLLQRDATATDDAGSLSTDSGVFPHLTQSGETLRPLPLASRECQGQHHDAIDQTTVDDTVVAQADPQGSLLPPTNQDETGEDTQLEPPGNPFGAAENFQAWPHVLPSPREGQHGTSAPPAICEQDRAPVADRATREERLLEEGKLLEVSPEERALSLPSSSLVADDGSGELDPLGRRALWDARGPVSAGGGRGTGLRGRSGQGRGAGAEGGTVWSRRRKQKEEEEAAAREAAKNSKEKRAKMVLEVLARSEHIFRCNAERRRRRSSGNGIGKRALENVATKDGEEGRAATAPKSEARPYTSPASGGRQPAKVMVASAVSAGNDNINSRGNDATTCAHKDNSSKPNLKNQSANIRGGKSSSSFPGSDLRPDKHESPAGHGPTAGGARPGDEEAAKVERRESGAFVAAKRVAARRRLERAEEEARKQEETSKLEARASAPTSSGISSTRPSGLSLGSTDGSTIPLGVSVPPAAGTNGSTRDVLVRVRVPVAAQEDTTATAGSTTLTPGGGGTPLPDTQVPDDDGNYLVNGMVPEPLSQTSSGNAAKGVNASAAAAAAADKARERQRDRRRRHRRKEREEEERSSRLLEELERGAHGSIASFKGWKHRDVLDRRRSTLQRELEKADGMAREGARLSTSASSLAKRRLKTTAAPMTARTATASVTIAGGRGVAGASANDALPSATHRQGLRTTSVGRQHNRRGQQQQQQQHQGEGDGVRIAGVDSPGPDKDPSLAEAGGQAGQPEHSVERSEDRAGRRPHLGLRERQRRRRKRQRSRKQPRQRQHHLRRWDSLSSQQGNSSNEDNDDGVGARTTPMDGSDVLDPPESVEKTSHNDTFHVDDTSYRLTVPTGVIDENAQIVLSDAEREGPTGRPAKQNVTAEPLAGNPATREPATSQRRSTARRRYNSVEPRTEEHGAIPWRGGEVETAQASGGGREGGVGIIGNGSESRASVALESRFRRSRRRKSQENMGVRAAARGRRERDVISIQKVYEKGIGGGTEAVAASDATPTAANSFEELALRRRDEGTPQAYVQLDSSVDCSGDGDDVEDANMRAEDLHDSLHRTLEGGVEALGVQTRGQESNAQCDDHTPEQKARDADSSTKDFCDVLRRVEELE
ncbi:hypothetical protein Esi_0009_0056 [Ectocarpus siliculosus]|uniref:Uncharacterized protein n=1 Tax=Ectocarpus siliculosus TaxID=2880 RepID=D8LTM9_ECTSI|nr:hypothetical protein Esi_0009_0056 [Ectocarpus siliculosus]|eukprot:CBN73926.1 hypothetical protein Esi_0009_0056 [Ectocarpus siliculosus]